MFFNWSSASLLRLYGLSHLMLTPALQAYIVKLPWVALTQCIFNTRAQNAQTLVSGPIAHVLFPPSPQLFCSPALVALKQRAN